VGPPLIRAPAGLSDRIRARAGRRLEAGTDRPGYIGRAAAALFGAFAARGIARPIKLPKGLRVIGVGSAVLGGAGKTPLAAALALELAKTGARVSLVGHAYRAAPGLAREVRLSDSPEVVGDDALLSARLLEGSGVSVIVAEGREAALERARSLGADIAIADGLLQASPVRVADSILVLDAGAPWGSGRCPPLGDLRAPEEALLAASDLAVLLVDAASAGPLPPSSARSPADPPSPRAREDQRPAPSSAIPLESSIEGAIDAAGRRHDLSALRPLRAGLLLAIAHPERVLRSLARRGITPCAVVTLADHASFAALLRRPPQGAAFDVDVDVWLTTSRCATKLPVALGAAPVLALDHRIDASPLASALLSRGWAGTSSAMARTQGALC
jgi:tetraacyldisaccharide 4'-kinase